MTNDDEMRCLITGKPIEQWAKDAMTRKRPRMTDPTPAEALKACPNPECQSSRIDTWAGERDRLRSAVQGYCECCDCGVRGPMTCGYSGAPVERCTEKAKSEAARMWNAFADALSPPDAGEVRTYRDGVEDAAKCADFAREHCNDGVGRDVAFKIAAAIRKLP